MSSIPTGGNLLLIFFKPLDVNSGLKCKCDLLMKNSIALSKYRESMKSVLSRFQSRRLRLQMLNSHVQLK